MAVARLKVDVRQLLLDSFKNPDFSACPCGDNMLQWIGTIRGGKGTAYEGREYKLMLDFPSTYPQKPPVVKFKTPCYHPNVDQQGNICLDILKENWSSSYDVRTILLSIQLLLGEPNNDSALNAEAAKFWNKEVYQKKLEKFEKEMAAKY
ncbi:ubiquitin-conjugating enzyme E2 C-like [Orbicella faveolata]|uniref:ubiquitin-conjugating enzyme E2 C-like n=1 Tax=Orbicella faveolata TaxID=48498 RepID=UPI0009E4D809|nr:ubiquitin-conjugating enzyme E2 C-like [Orbicella faveolata]